MSSKATCGTKVARPLRGRAKCLARSEKMPVRPGYLPSCTAGFPRKPARLVRGDAVTVRQIPRIDRKVDAVRQPRLLVAAAGGETILLADVRACHGQPAAGAAAPALALARGVAGADIAGAEQVQRHAPQHAPSQDDSQGNGWGLVSHFFAGSGVGCGSVAPTVPV
jgi:hypothetical protein